MSKKPQHAVLAPSASHRWMNCPGSVELSKDVPNESSEASRRGTGAHALAAELLTGKEYKIGDGIEFRDGEAICNLIIDEDLMAGVLVYTEHVNALAEYMPNPELWLEQAVKLHGTYGTGDAFLRDGVTLHVLDYKNGRVPVLLKDGETYNSQLLFYAAAALKKFDKHGEIQQIVLHIVQPNSPDVNQIQTETIPAHEVRRWAETELKAAMKRAKDPNAELVAGDWCRFCPAQAKCPALAAQMNELAAADFTAVAQPVLPQPSALTTVQVANILKWAPVVDDFLAAVAARALDEMQKGAVYPGFKLVRKKTNRKWPTEDAVELRGKLIVAGAPVDLAAHDLLEQPDLLSPAKLEKRFKWAKSVGAKVAGKPEGDLTVAPDSDSRDAVMPSHDFKEFQMEDLI